MTSQDPPRYADQPCYTELVAIVLVGMLHVLTEINLSEWSARLYNAAASLGFLAYLLWRVKTSNGVFRAWGMRLDNFWQSLSAQCIVGAIGAVAILSNAVASDSLSIPWTFLVTLLLYPVWGIAQQFALQNLVARNLSGLLSHPLAVASVSAALFAAAHYPRMKLVLLTLVWGFVSTLVHRRTPNLWAVGVVHGVLGSLAMYAVMQEDPGHAIWSFLFGS